jgi:hypothetical protein
MGRAYSTNGEKRKETVRRPRLRWVDNIKSDLREVGQDSMDWTDLAQDRGQWRFVNMVINLPVPQNVGSSSAAAQLVAS